MNKQEFIEELVKNKILQIFARHIKNDISKENLNDLVQDTYVYILELDDDKYNDLFLNNKIFIYLYRLLKNQIFSKNSRYYYNYVRSTRNTTPIENIYDLSYDDARISQIENDRLNVILNNDELAFLKNYEGCDFNLVKVGLLNNKTYGKNRTTINKIKRKITRNYDGV